MFERIFIASIEQSNAINAAADKECDRPTMASFYMDCIIADNQARANNSTRVDWAAVNNAILARWSRGLDYIKHLAWKKLDANVGFRPRSK